MGPLADRLVSLAILFLDPVSIGLNDPDGRSFTYNLKDESVSNGLPRAFVEVGGIVEVVVIPNPVGTYALSVADVPSGARGGLVYLSDQGSATTSFTDLLRTGTIQFAFTFGEFAAFAQAPAPQPVDSPIAADEPSALGSIATGLSALQGATMSRTFAMGATDLVTASNSATSESTTSWSAPQVRAAPPGRLGPGSLARQPTKRSQFSATLLPTCGTG